MTSDAAKRLRKWVAAHAITDYALRDLDEALAADREVAEDVAKAIGGFLWLANNLHNVDSPQFVGMFRAAAEDARPIYEKYAAILAEKGT